ncbi:MAG: NERD domain-containing protein [Candidatus Hodarchaeota archaeon]
MSNLYSEASLQNFFTEIYSILKETDPKIIEIWCEISKISFFNGLRKTELYNFLDKFEFISLKKGNYVYYIVIDKVLFIINCIKFLKYDVAHLSEILDYNGFESLIKEILSKNNFRTITNFRFSEISKLSSNISQKKFEIDVIGIYLNYILIIDAKQWKRKDSYGSLNKAANLQYNRIRALQHNDEAFSKLIKTILGKDPQVKRHLPFILIPVMVTLEDNSIKLNENQIPLVSIYEFNVFLQEFPNYLHYFKSVQVNKVVL